MKEKLLLLLDPDKEKQEKDVHKQICEYIDKNESFIFYAGAGAGKTFELVQALKYIVISKGRSMALHRQKILCITYTNAAANEIKERLGNSSIIYISTIHEFLWSAISPYQKQLVQIHLDNLVDSLSKIEHDLKNETWATVFCGLSEPQRQEFMTIFSINENLKLYYDNKNKGAVDFKNSLKSFFDDTKFPNLLNNVGNFKKIVDVLIKKNNFESAKEKIIAKEKKYCSVKYGLQNNHDRLHKMEISHDTLLDYAEKIVAQNKILRRLLLDHYPYILVDESQDTNSKVVELLKHLYCYSGETKRVFLLAFFGDVMQKIYKEGVGNIKEKICIEKKVIKGFNRRSAPEIIAVSNLIRNDGITQQTIFSNFPKGDVSFYNVDDDESMEKLIEMQRSKWGINSQNKLHCLELRNRNIAKRMGFSEIFTFFEQSEWYSSGKNFELLGQHILNSDKEKRAEIQNLFLKIIEFKINIQNNKSFVQNLLQSKELRNLSIVRLNRLLSVLHTLEGKTLLEYLLNIFSLYKSEDKFFKSWFEGIFGEDIITLEDFKQHIIHILFSVRMDKDDTQSKEVLLTVENFLALDVNVFINWYNYLHEKTEGDLVFHTLHSTKGLEYDNVLIILENNFARDAQYFSKVFLSMEKGKTNLNEEGRNLFYVAVTRAKRNLCVLYQSNMTNDEEEIIKKIFGSIIKKI